MSPPGSCWRWRASCGRCRWDGRVRSRRPLRDQHAAAELADDLVALAPGHGLDVDDAAVGLRPRLRLLEHGRLGVDGVAVERRLRVLERLDLEVRDRLA